MIREQFENMIKGYGGGRVLMALEVEKPESELNVKDLANYVKGCDIIMAALMDEYDRLKEIENRVVLS